MKDTPLDLVAAILVKAAEGAETSAGAPPELQFEYHPFPFEAWLVEPLEMLFEPHGHNRCIRVRSLEPQHNGAVIYALPERLYILPNAPERSAS